MVAANLNGLDLAWHADKHSLLFTISYPFDAKGPLVRLSDTVDTPIICVNNAEFKARLHLLHFQPLLLLAVYIKVES